ncbi:hypothetical protein [Candidatus Frankia alpina]|uniref:Uncharacterized protein n=1 Tax=Candidatus Frankia alpina TaxID=2699483 RepID=A0A4S5EKG4_9ACTN|nr:hypothetical protein [Candidatus Frankia alpina]THJ72641.1 hypothetical protein E7Y31_14245 [Candidatus Frankia alpina]
MTAPFLAPAPARTGRQIAALHAAVALLERLGSLAVLTITVDVDYSPDLVLGVEAQVTMHAEDHDQRDTVCLDRLNAASVALGLPIRHEWTRDGLHAFGLAAFDVNGVPVHLWTAFADPAITTRAHALTTLHRR